MYNDKDIEREKLLYLIKITMFIKVCWYKLVIATCKQTFTSMA